MEAEEILENNIRGPNKKSNRKRGSHAKSDVISLRPPYTAETRTNSLTTIALRVQMNTIGLKSLVGAKTKYKEQLCMRTTRNRDSMHDTCIPHWITRMGKARVKQEEEADTKVTISMEYRYDYTGLFESSLLGILKSF